MRLATNAQMRSCASTSSASTEPSASSSPPTEGWVHPLQELEVLRSPRSIGLPADLELETLGSLVEIEDLGRRGVHPTFGEVTLEQLLATWVVHDLNHIGQIVKTMAKQYRQAVRPCSEFLFIVSVP